VKEWLGCDDYLGRTVDVARDLRQFWGLISRTLLGKDGVEEDD